MSKLLFALFVLVTPGAGIVLLVTWVVMMILGKPEELNESSNEKRNSKSVGRNKNGKGS